MKWRTVKIRVPRHKIVSQIAANTDIQAKAYELEFENDMEETKEGLRYIRMTAKLANGLWIEYDLVRARALPTQMMLWSREHLEQGGRRLDRECA